MAMFTQIYLYVIIYFSTLLLIFYYFFILKTPQLIIQYSLSQLWSLTTMYYKQSWIFKFLIFQLSGLPPVFLFFVKSSLLVNAGPAIDIFLICLIFLNLLLSMFFYLKVFSSTSNKCSNKALKSFVSNRPILEMSKKKNVKKLYSATYLFMIFIFCNIFSLFFYADIYIALFSIIMS